MERIVPPIHAPDHVPGGPDPIRYVPLKIKLSGDRTVDDPVEADDRAFTFDCEPDFDKLFLRLARVSVGVVSSSGSVTVMLTNETQSRDLLSSAAGVGSGSFTADISSSIAAEPDNQVFEDDLIVVAIVGAGTDAKGLTLSLLFSR